jgi:hypothetical protein
MSDGGLAGRTLNGSRNTVFLKEKDITSEGAGNGCRLFPTTFLRCPTQLPTMSDEMKKQA